MSREITTATAVGIGILGLGLFGYKMYTNGSLRPNLSSRKQKIKPTTLQRRDKRIDKVGNETRDKIQMAETQCFKGVNNTLKLSISDIQKIASNLRAQRRISEEDVSDMNTLTDVLMKLSNNHILAPINYQEVVTSVLHDVGLELNEKAEELLQLLRNTVLDHLETDIQNARMQAWESKSKKIDIYILYSQEDYTEAEKFRDNIYQHVNTRDIKIVLMDDVGIGQTTFDSFDEAMKSSIYTFVFVTEMFCRDTMKIFLSQAGLVNYLQKLRSSEKLWRFVPVWVDPGINERELCPNELSLIQGLRYDRFLENKEHARCFEHIDKLIRIGRRREMEESD